MERLRLWLVGVPVLMAIAVGAVLLGALQALFWFHRAHRLRPLTDEYWDMLR